MISLKINNIKNFTSHLLVKDTFADFGLVEGQINTHSTFTINGRINEQYYSSEELEALGDNQELTSWGLLRPICYEIIKGKSLPTSFRFVLKLGVSQTAALTETLPDYKQTDVGGLFLNIKYDAGNLSIVTGTSMKIFTLDKSLDKAFDSYITQFLEKNSIEFSIC